MEWTQRRHIAWLAPVTLVLAALSDAAAIQVEWKLISGAVSANDMSPDGRFVVGSLTGGTPYLWDTLEDSMMMLPPEGSARAVSDDGKVVLGEMPDPDSPDPALGVLAAIWTAADGWKDIGYLPNSLNCPSKSNGYELSADGSVAVGLSWDGCSGRGFRWTEATGMVELEPLANGGNRASVISADGTVIGGFAQGSGSRTPAIWDGNTTDGQLLDPPNGDAGGEIYGISDDGSILLGSWGVFPDPAFTAHKWTNMDGTWVREKIQNGSYLPGWAAAPMDIADDGTIVGFDFLLGNRRAWIQPQGAGPLMQLRDFVESNGGSVPANLLLEVPQAISSDGRQIVGHGFGNAWRIAIFDDCDFDRDGECHLDDIDALVMEIVAGANDPTFDLTGDDLVNLDDQNEWLAQAGAVNLPSGNSYLLGDANLDGTVDEADAQILDRKQIQFGGCLVGWRFQCRRVGGWQGLADLERL